MDGGWTVTRITDRARNIHCDSGFHLSMLAPFPTLLRHRILRFHCFPKLCGASRLAAFGTAYSKI